MRRPRLWILIPGGLAVAWLVFHIILEFLKPCPQFLSWPIVDPQLAADKNCSFLRPDDAPWISDLRDSEIERCCATYGGSADCAERHRKVSDSLEKIVARIEAIEAHRHATPQKLPQGRKTQCGLFSSCRFHRGIEDTLRFLGNVVLFLKGCKERY